MVEEGGQPHSWLREHFDHHEGCLGLGQSFREVRSGGEGGGEPVAQRSELHLEVKGFTIQVDGGG